MESPNESQKVYNLEQNYPNPFNPATQIQYYIPVAVPSPDFVGIEGPLVTLKVFDVLGREVSTLVNEKQKPGNYEVEFDGSELTSGIYFYRLQVYPAIGWAGDYIETKKMVLLK